MKKEWLMKSKGGLPKIPHVEPLKFVTFQSNQWPPMTLSLIQIYSNLSFLSVETKIITFGGRMIEL